MGAERDHYFSADPQAPQRLTQVVFTAADHTFRLSGAAGVFSAGRLDPGTAVLLRKAQLPGPESTGPLLDLGCGYGPIACVLATLAPAATVYAIDVNARARELARGNAMALGLADRVVVAAPDEVSDSVKFSGIWCNPPIRVGKTELHAMLVRWLARLAPSGLEPSSLESSSLEPGGVAWLVVARHLGSDSLAIWLAQQGFSVVRHASQQGFRVLRVTSPSL